MRTELSGRTIGPELLRNYKKALYPARRIMGRDVARIRIHDEPKAPLVRLVHTVCNWPANMMAWGPGYVDKLRDHIPIADTDPALMQQIGRNFTLTQADLEGDHTTLTKGQVVDAFAAYYHLIQPSTDSARYLRSLIEEAFNVLDLGPIPPAKHVESLNTRTGRAR